MEQNACNNLPVPLPDMEKPVAFKKLEIESPLPNTQAAVVIRLPQATFEIAEGTSQQTIQAVLMALKMYVRQHHSCRKYLYRMWIHRKSSNTSTR